MILRKIGNWKLDEKNPSLKEIVQVVRETRGRWTMAENGMTRSFNSEVKGSGNDGTSVLNASLSSKYILFKNLSAKKIKLKVGCPGQNCS